MHSHRKNDKKSIKSALNDKKRKCPKLTIGGQNSIGTNSIFKHVQQMTKSVLRNVKMIRNEKSYYHLLSFFVFCAVPYCHLLSFLCPYSVPRVKKYHSIIVRNKLIFCHLCFFCYILRGQVNILHRKIVHIALLLIRSCI